MTDPRPDLGLQTRPATLQSVADAAGVHRSTAARALDPAQSHRISAEVVTRVREAAMRQGYRRNTTAASLRTGRSRLVGAVLPDLANPVFAPILSGVSAALAKEGYSLLVADGGGSENDRIQIVEQLIARGVDGLVLATARRVDKVVSLCLERKVPTVLVNRAEDSARVSSVASDDLGGMRLAVEHLVSFGHRNIGHLAGPDDLSTGVLRRRGFVDAMTAAGLDATRIVTASAYSRDAGRVAANALLDRHPRITAIAAGNDLLALGSFLALTARGMSCPADVSIVGHNDMPLMDMVAPPLTTIRIAPVAMGAEAATLLLTQIAGSDTSLVTKTTEAELVLRASTKRVG
jgi:LacI family transcriptional regulator